TRRGRGAAGVTPRDQGPVARTRLRRTKPTPPDAIAALNKAGVMPTSAQVRPAAAAAASPSGEAGGCLSHRRDSTLPNAPYMAARAETIRRKTPTPTTRP